MERTANLPLKIKRLLEEKGYFDFTQEERLEKHKKCMLELEKINHFDYKAGKKALKELRGE